MTTKKIVLLVATVVVVLALLAAVFVGAIVGFGLYQVGSSQATAKAKDFLRSSEKLKTDIGEVKDFGSIVTANVVNNTGETTLKLTVIGRRQTVKASVDLIYTKGSTWHVSAASYVNSSGQTIDLLDPYDSQILSPQLIA
ncbi:MAG TPA: cytochrome c oxidase assembly factor Coa1 family protein [Pyrinomonadaceae bacterium]|jgi:hypothetical protein